MRCEPDVRQELVEFARGVGRQATEDIPEVREGINVEVLTVAVEEESTAAVLQPRSRPLS